MRAMTGTMLILLTIGSAHAEEWGTISGQIIVEGEVPDPELLIPKDANIKDREVCAAKDHYAEDLIVDKQTRGLANVFIYLARKPKLIHPEMMQAKESEVNLRIRGCQYDPHCFIVRTSQTVTFYIEDPVAHNVQIYPARNSPLGGLASPKGSIRLRLAESFPFKVTCGYHPNMQAHCLVVDHPYATLTDREGRFEMKHLPAGEHKFRIWHERHGMLEKEFKITVTTGRTVELPVIKVDIACLMISDPVK